MRRKRRCTETLDTMFSNARVGGVTDFRCDLIVPHEVHRIDRANPPIVWRVLDDGTIRMGQRAYE